MAVTLNRKELEAGTIIEVAQVPPKLEVFEDEHGWGIRFLWPENPDYIPVEHYIGGGLGRLEAIKVPLFDPVTKTETTGTILITGKR